MKIEKISYNKIKVTVTTLDMIKWGISLDNFVQDTPEARELFRTLIKRAEFETGFSFDDSRLMVEAIPHKYDGIVLFVTKMDDEVFELPQTAKKSKIRAKAPRRQSAADVFEFKTIDSLIEFANHSDDFYAADLYGYLNSYYLVVYGGDCTYISEYGDRLPGDGYALSRIKEHGTLIAKHNALEVLKNYF